MIIITMTHTTSLEQRQPYIEGHKQFITKCITAGVLIAAGPTDAKAGGVLLMNLASNEVEDLMRQDPFIKAKVSNYTVTSFKVKMCHENFLSLKEL